MHELSLRALGATIAAFIDGDPSAPRTPSDARARRALARLQPWLERTEASLSRFRPDSELSRLNARGSTVVASTTLLAAVKRALAAARATDGLVTPLVLPALLAAGYGRSFAALAPPADDSAAAPAADGPAAADLPRPPAPVADFRAVVLDEERAFIRLPPGAGLDLGGTVKGAWADAAARALASAGPALVDAGGDIAVSGPRADGTAWPVGIADPHRPDELLELLAVRAGGVATSGTDVRRWGRGPARAHHLIDPRTGAPATTDVLAATVVGPSAFAAEVAAKVVCLSGARAGLAFIDDQPGLAALVVRTDGGVQASRRLRSHIWLARPARPPRRREA